MTEQHYNVVTHDLYEPRNCFKQSKHGDHIISFPANDGSVDENDQPRIVKYWCNGNAPRPAPEGWTDEGHWKNGVPPIEWKGATPTIQKTMPEQGDETDALLESRGAVYGDRTDMMRRTAMIWSGLTGFKFEAWMIPQLMSAYKKLRTFNAPDYSDNIDDDEGWLRMFREQMAADGTPIIHARTVEEYLRIKLELQNDGPGAEDLIDPALAIEVQARYGGPATHRLMPHERADIEAQKDDQAAGPLTCLRCRHAYHGNGVCFNMASDNDCTCTGA